MQTLKTHKGDTLLLIEVLLDAYDFEIADTLADTFLFYRVGKERISANYRTYPLPNNKYEIIGTTSTLTDEQVMDFIEWSEGREDTMCFKDYTQERHYTFIFPLESWNSFLQHKGIDLTKNYCVLKLLND